MAINLKNYDPALMQGANVDVSLSDVTIDDIVVGGTLAVTGASTLTGLTTMAAYTTTGVHIGEKVAVTASGGTTRTLTAANSGSVNLFDSAAGIAYTLPATAVGLSYTFVTTVTQTSSAHSITTPASSFLMGTVLQGAATSATVLVSTANGSSHTAYSTNGTTKGGVIGTYLTVTAVSATVWAINGFVIGTGTHATPFA